MQNVFKSLSGKSMVIVGAVVILAGVAAVRAEAAGDIMPASQQRGLVQKYCAACHDDARMVGGLSLEHFDASRANPAVAAMMLSKLTNGLTLQTVRAADTDAAARTLLDKELKTSAIFAAGVPPPDIDTLHRWISALSAEATGATEWTTSNVAEGGNEPSTLIASVVKEFPSPKDASKADIYRLTLTCRTATHEAEMTLTWAPGDLIKDQEVSAAVDGKDPVIYKVETKQWMGTNNHPTSGAGALVLYSTRGTAAAPVSSAPLSVKTLTVNHVLQDGAVAFPLAGLRSADRQALWTCFAGGGPSK
jgi:hypothetical protein